MRYVAIGDSFSEGMGDELPDGTVRGWTDLVAAGLSAGLAARGETLEYANLAIRGRLLRPIVTTQLDAALALQPPADLLTFNGGGNDMMRAGVDLAELVAMIEQAVRRCVDARVRPVVLSGADPTAQLPFGRTIHRRGTYLTAATAEVCARHDVTLVNVFDDLEIRHHRYWSPDRLHLNAAGHQRAAGLILTAMGHPTAAHIVDPGSAESRRLLAEARYYREHVLPWVHRRVRGRSSGDDRTAKFPQWTRIGLT